MSRITGHLIAHILYTLAFTITVYMESLEIRNIINAIIKSNLVIFVAL